MYQSITSFDALFYFNRHVKRGLFIGVIR
jgi:hypothetical protein